MAKQIIYWDDLRAKMFAWIETVAKTVTVTMWPKWRNVILDNWFGIPQVTNDWVTIAREIELEDKFENMWAELVKQAASKTNDLAWDGTTTATLLTYALAKEGLRNIRTWINAIELKNGMKKAWTMVIEELHNQSKKISTKQEIAQVASLSAQDSEVWEIIALAMDKVGNNWVISVEEWQTFWLELEVTQGMEIDKWYISPYMVTSWEKMISEFRDAPILLTDQKISSMKDLLPLLEQLVQEWKKELVIIAEDIEWEALTTIILNKLKWVLNILWIKAPGFWDNKKELLKDISVLTKANIITSELSMKLENAWVSDLWYAKTVISSLDKTTIIGWAGSTGDISSRVWEIQATLKSTKASYEKEKLMQRIARLAGWVAVIKVWAASEVEMKEKKLRIEDALNATRAAVEEWVVLGWWVALLKAWEILVWKNLENEDQTIWLNIVQKALSYPLRQIAENAWKEWSVIISKVLESKNKIGYNAATDEFVDMFKYWIVDPTKVERVALEEAISLSGMFLTTESWIVDVTEKKDTPMPPAGWMPGMWGWMWMY